MGQFWPEILFDANCFLQNDVSTTVFNFSLISICLSVANVTLKSRMMIHYFNLYARVMLLFIVIHYEYHGLSY